MGLIKAISGAVGGVLSDLWKEFIYCDEMTPETIIIKGRKRTSSQGRSSNTISEDNIISNGSVIAVNVGQCAIIVESGKVAELCAEPGQFVYDKSTEPSIFSGSLGSSIVGTFKQIGRRFTFGGDPGKDQRVYYFNTKELIGNKYGTPSLIPFPTILDLSGVQRKLMVRIKCFGEYSYRVVAPILFYTNVAGNVSDEYVRSEIDSQLKTELLTALRPAFAKIGAMKISYDELPAHTMELADALNEQLSAKWRNLRGIEIVSFGVSSVRADEENEKRIMDAQNTTFYTDPNLAAGRLVGAQSEAMVTTAVIPFGITEEEAFQILKKWMEENKGKPETELLRAHMDELRTPTKGGARLRGVYPPYRLFQGPFSFTVRRAQGNEREFAGESFLSHKAIVTSDNLPNDLLDCVEPFDWSGLREFHFVYLAGLTAQVEKDGYDKTVEDLSREVYEDLDGYVRASMHTPQTQSKIDLGGVASAPILLPIYYVSIGGDSRLQVAINGQTGQVAVYTGIVEKKTPWYIEPVLLTALLYFAWLRLIRFPEPGKTGAEGIFRDSRDTCRIHRDLCPAHR